MVSVVQLVPRDAPRDALATLGADLAEGEREVLGRALEFAHAAYHGQQLSTGEPVWPHALGLAGSLAAVGMDVATRMAGVLFAAPKYVDKPDALRAQFGEEVERLAAGVEKLYRLRVVIRAGRGSAAEKRVEREKQTEVLRKMVLAMVEDIRVVLIRLASRTQTLRWFAKNAMHERRDYAQETLDIYAPLANRLGVWQLKWEMEDLSFRFLEPELYKAIASQLDEKRAEREVFIREAKAQLARELEAAGVKAEIAGRPKHIYSIRAKMRAKDLDFSELHDVRALRVVVDSVKDCYAALGVVHNLWTPIPREFDDYISRPKPNGYRSLHTAVSGPDGRALEVQIRTQEMHRHAEFGVAAHWRYKETSAAGGAQTAAKPGDAFEQRIAWLRQLLAWRDEVVSSDSVEQLRHGASDETVYALTPQGRVIDLPAGATPVDFAYALHTDLGHRCRGAKVDGRMVPLDRALANGQRVEIVAAKTGGPSRDWINPELGYLKSHRARSKVKQWFNNLALADTIATGRAQLERELQRVGQTRANLERLAAKLGFARPDDLFAAVARDEVNLRQLQSALRGEVSTAESLAPAPAAPRKAKSAAAPSGILVVGIDRLLTQVAKCCKPVPPDAIRGFVTRGRGVSIHRADCADLQRLMETHPERLIEAAWGENTLGAYAVEVQVVANDRQGLLRDIGDALARERINVTAVRTQTRQDIAWMNFSFEVADLAQLRRALAVIKEVPGVIRAARA
ncbi:MAG: bifunctional (p)ppGpp synthetase/guanosine-3',5'-bis(diphosphate) 3'-pyrophosphohydrolase [Betaproteobacteria bacterium]|nr:bifunctional (p)ppGpp synthetase/guanosine-3',5'-bis(diphosphate) 3'-pyrophosphohydrolase [Betaproteobacteria bacterium]